MLAMPPSCRWIDGRAGVSRSNASDFRKLFDACILDRGSVVWEAMAYPAARIQASFGAWGAYDRVRYAAGSCNALQHAATRCNTLQRAATRCNALQRAATEQ